MTIQPFIKWAGGKRWLAEQVKELYDIAAPKRYIEPFLGGGAVFFSIRPRRAILSDVNGELIEAYEVVRDSPAKLLASLAEMHERHCETYYYATRGKSPDTKIQRAARFIYLNRTCWNGLYRVNQLGKFNVPIGTKNWVIQDGEDFKENAAALDCAILRCRDFSTTLAKATTGDFVYIDPPYTVKHNKNGFLKYNDKIFSWKDQERLKKCAQRAADRGARVVISNADHESIRELYRDNFSIQVVSRFSKLAGDPLKRSKTTEVLISSI